MCLLTTQAVAGYDGDVEIFRSELNPETYGLSMKLEKKPMVTDGLGRSRGSEGGGEMGALQKEMGKKEGGGERAK